MAIYEGDHSITFGDGTLVNQKFVGKNTWTDWHLIPAERPTPAMPGFTTKYVSIPGRDGSIDLSEFLVKRPVYGDRSGSIQFYVDHEHYKDGENWVSLYHDIATFLHGRRMKMCFEDDPTWYYEGRFALSELSPEASFSTLTINYQVGPFKYRIYTSGDSDILWDTFNFDTDYDYSVFYHRYLPAGSSVSFTIDAFEAPMGIDILVDSGAGYATMNGISTLCGTGRTTIGTTHVGSNAISVNATANMTFSLSFREVTL